MWIALLLAVPQFKVSKAVNCWSELAGQGYIATLQQSSLNKLSNLKEKMFLLSGARASQHKILSPATRELVMWQIFIFIFFGGWGEWSTINMQGEVLMLISPSRKTVKVLMIDGKKIMANTYHKYHKYFFFSHFLENSQATQIIHGNNSWHTRKKKSQYFSSWK